MSVTLPCTAHDVLKHLAAKGPTVPQDLADALHKAPLTVYRALRVLKSRGLVDRRELPQDGPGRSACEWFLIRNADNPKPEIV